VDERVNPLDEETGKIYHRQLPVRRGNYRRPKRRISASLQILIPQIPDGFYIRSLLSGKSLEEHLGVAIDAKVLHGLRVRSRGVCPALNGGSSSKGRSRVPAKGLHGGRVEEEEGKVTICKGERGDCTAGRARQALEV
jgi:hypothetical protein